MTNSWRSQAKASVEGTTDARYRSAAVYCEVKLAEALSKAPQVEESLDGEHPKPQGFRSAVCMELLGELCELCGPFAGVLRSVRDELAKSIYSDYYLSESGTLSFDQLPYFTVVERLEIEKSQMLEERERWRAELLNRQDDISRIEDRMRGLEEQVKTADTLNRDLAAKLEESNERAANSKTEARASREELKRLRKELLKAKEDMQRMRASGQMQQVEAEELEKLRRTCVQSQKELVRALTELEKERSNSADSVPRGHLDDAMSRAS